LHCVSHCQLWIQPPQIKIIVGHPKLLKIFDSIQNETGPTFAISSSMQNAIKSLFITVILATAFSAAANELSTVEVKGDSLRQLQELRNQNVKRLHELDLALAKKFDDVKMVNLEEDVETLKAERHEHILRQDFLDRLIFQLDTKYSGGDLRLFLEKTLVEMAKVDATSPAATGGGLWKFLKYSADAIHRLPEQKENILAFLEGYMNLSVSNPVLPEEYLAARNYTNGSKSEQGHPMNRDQVGTVVDSRLKATTAVATDKAPPAAAPTIQQR
jgi:hypothetical protein